MSRTWSAMVAVALLWPAPAAAQSAESAALYPPFGRTAAQDTARPGNAFSLLRVAKWSTLGLATAAGIYGFVENAHADDRYSELERMCEEQRSVCMQRTESGSYQDEAFETLFQTVRRHDRRAHSALVAGQIGVAASVVFFLLDLGNVRSPDDIPWTPGSVRWERSHGVTSVGIHLPVSFLR